MIRAQRVDFVAVPTRDRERAVAFYGDTLGIPLNPVPHGESPEFETANVTFTIELMHEAEFQPLPFGTIVLRVPSVHTARSELEAAGVRFDSETIDSGVCHKAFFRDPDGNGLMLHHRYAPYADGRHPDEQL